MRDVRELKEFTCCGYACAIVPHHLGHWCGYVGVPQNHVIYGVHYQEESSALFEKLEQLKQKPFDPEKAGMGLLISVLSGHVKASPDTVIEVHGGITFSDNYCPCVDDKKELWWFGFDCGHAGDAPHPGTKPNYTIGRGIYRDSDYAIRETKKLARQLFSIHKNVKGSDLHDNQCTGKNQQQSGSVNQVGEFESE